ncbi:MAG: leucine-rich repeat domain-containing protein [Butyrivibrio sp.]|jgi:hypothetical protein|nr:leucine-rich repeat domain-containing protein [Butyrivibrio sp.]
MRFEWEKTEIKGSIGICITGCSTTPERLTVPEEEEGLPVHEIGNHAFASRNTLKEVFLPEKIRIIRGFAFHNCPELKCIHLYDSVADYYDGVIRQCDGLRLIDLTCRQENFSIIRSMLADSDRELSFALHLPGDQEAFLTFPAFVYDFVENTMARTIQFAIDGSGYRYRECISDHQIDYREYDGLFDRAVSDDRHAAAVIALGRLMYPYRLETQGKMHYEAYLRDNSWEILPGLIMENKVSELRFLTEHGLPDQKATEEAIRFASEKRRTQLCGILMEYQRKKSGRGSQPDIFSLGDL